jgi:hypothetical protein
MEEIDNAEVPELNEYELLAWNRDLAKKQDAAFNELLNE